MGPVKSFIEGLDASEENNKKSLQALEISVKLIETRFKVFESELNIGIGQVQKLPAQYLLTTHKNISAQVSSGMEKVRDTIKGIVSSFTQGKIADGITNVLFGSLDAILGTYSASYNQTQDYMVLTNLIGGLFRIDYLVVQQRLSATGIKSKLSSIFGSYMIVSSIHKSQLKDGADNVYRVLVDRQFADKDMKDKFMIMRMLKEEELEQGEIEHINGWDYAPPKFQGGKLIKNGVEQGERQRERPRLGAGKKESEKKR